MLSKKDKTFSNAIEGKFRVQCRASERLQDQIIEEIKEMEYTKTEEALQLVRKEHDLWICQNEQEEAKNCRAPGRMRKWLGRHLETYQTGQTGKRRERCKKTSGGWSLNGKRKCRKSLSCRMRWKALLWTWMAKAATIAEAKLSKREREAPNEEGVRR